MIEIQNTRINTAGVYICIHGYYLFAMGIRLHNGRIPIVRIGGHCEGGESGWQCAVREAREETGLQIEPLRPKRTYLSDWDHMQNELQEIQWEAGDQESNPMLIITYRREEKNHLSVMYLAAAQGSPVPSSEVKGLILLRKEEIYRLCQDPITLEQYLADGGQAIMGAEFNLGLGLEPFPQLRLLARILSREDQC